MPSAAPCQPVAAPVVAQKQTVETPAVAGSEDVDDEVVAATVLENAKLLIVIEWGLGGFRWLLITSYLTHTP